MGDATAGALGGFDQALALQGQHLAQVEQLAARALGHGRGVLDLQPDLLHRRAGAASGEGGGLHQVLGQQLGAAGLGGQAPTLVDHVGHAPDQPQQADGHGQEQSQGEHVVLERHDLTPIAPGESDRGQDPDHRHQGRGGDERRGAGDGYAVGDGGQGLEQGQGGALVLALDQPLVGGGHRADRVGRLHLQGFQVQRFGIGWRLGSGFSLVLGAVFRLGLRLGARIGGFGGAAQVVGHIAARLPTPARRLEPERGRLLRFHAHLIQPRGVCGVHYGAPAQNRATDENYRGSRRTQSKISATCARWRGYSSARRKGSPASPSAGPLCGRMESPSLARPPGSGPWP